MVESRSFSPEISRLKCNLRVLGYKPGTSFDLDPEILAGLEFSLNDVSLVIEYGSKTLALDFFDWPDSLFIHAQTELKRLDDRQKVPKDTTWVYRQAFDMMQRVANYYGRPVMYLFHTANEGLAQWAEDRERGASVFKWDSKVVADRFYCLKIIEPA